MHTTHKPQPWKIGSVELRQYVDVNLEANPIFCVLNLNASFCCVVCVSGCVCVCLCVASPYGFDTPACVLFTSTLSASHAPVRCSIYSIRKSENNRTDLFYGMNCV